MIGREIREERRGDGIKAYLEGVGWGGWEVD